ncbi:CHAT domain-containing protein [Opitutaceae bacterium TAV4]|nr:CHAT domain-containing protein [Opitutaceae bacterium TAV4]RRK01876.1 CHAT domain-containing protein [Opitutaceae bacterium TAV3]
MNSDYYRRRVLTKQTEIAQFQNEKAREAARAADYQRRASDAQGRASRASSVSSAQSYLRDAQRQAEQALAAQKKVADIETKIARKQSEMGHEQKSLNQAEQREAEEARRVAERRLREEKQRERDHEMHMRSISQTLNQHGVLHRQTLDTLEKLTQLPERITVLFMASNPLDQTQLRLDEEARAIAETIRKSEHRDAVALVSCWAVRPLDVLQALNEHRPRIVHFSGHGSDQDEIVFQDNQGAAKLVTKEAITQTMAAGSAEIQLVFFNTCYSRNQAEAVVQHVPAAIGMKTSIGDEAARVFAAAFYSAIGFGLSVGRAFAQAKAALMLEGIPEQDTPELFMAQGVQAYDLVLVKPAGAKGPSES